MQLAEDHDLRQYLRKNHENLNWQKKLVLLLKKSFQDLKRYMNQILISDNYNELYIIDLGLCKPISSYIDLMKKVYPSKGKI